MKKEKTKKDSKSEERRTGAILEDINSKLDLVVEGHQGLDKKIDENHREFKEFRGEANYKFDLLVEGQQVLDKKIDKVDEKVEELRGEMNYKFGVVFEKFDEVNGELHLVRNELKEKVSRDEFVLLEKRVMNLEKKISQKI